LIRRRAIRLSLVALLCLLLGAATTVGVAWRVGRPARMIVAQADGTIDVPDDAPIPDPLLRRIRGLQWDLVGFTAPGGPGRSILSAGWPLLAVRSDEGFLSGRLSARDRPWRFESWREGVVAPDSWVCIHRHLPIMPLFPGFAIDTAFYAAAWWMLLFTPLPLYRTARRRLRVSRGMCPSCGYDLKGSPGGACPECGHTAGGKP
jgi:hypothetical protein